MTALPEALTHLANYADLDVAELLIYAAEDTISGRGAGEYDAWSIDADEGKLLYALTRALQAQQVIEIGVRHGASTAHLLAALNANGSGHLDSYDLEANGNEQHANWTFHQGDALTADFPPADLVFEDGGHGLDFTLTVFTKLKPTTRILVTHDINMTTAHGDFHVAEAFATVFPDGITITLDGCERGLGVWVNPTWQAVKWDFGDGTTLVTGSDADVVHKYADSGVYEVSREAVAPPKPARKPRTPAVKKPMTKAKAKR